MIVIWITTIIVSAIAALVGSLMISRRVSLVSGPLGHLAFPGVAIALLYNFNLFLGALLFILFAALLIWILKSLSNLPLEALTGIIFAFSLSIGFLLLPIENAEEAIVGDVTKIGISDFYLSLAFSLIIAFIIAKIYKKVIIVTLSRDLAKSLGINTSLLELIYILLIALVAAMEVKIVGGILTVALIIIPSSASCNFARNLKEYLILSPLIGALSAIIGLSIYSLTKLPAGPLIIVSSFSIFLISLAFRKLSK